eukprot:jgi/Psemu1/200277/e_gw1.254.42.1
MTRIKPTTTVIRTLSILATIAAIPSASYTIAAEAFSASSSTTTTPPTSTTTVVTDIPPLIDVPVWSMATINERDESIDPDNSKGKRERERERTTNMNILTYATPVSIRPDRLYALGLYKPTQSRKNLLRERTCVLQLLAESHVPCVRLLGGTSGSEICKEDALRDLLGVELQQLQLDVSSSGTGTTTSDGTGTGTRTELPRVLPGCVRYLRLSVVGDEGSSSHDVVICRVEETWTSCVATGAATGADDSNSNSNSNSNLAEPAHLSTGRLRELGIITEQGRIAPEEPTP